jgi:hypothetical protein
MVRVRWAWSPKPRSAASRQAGLARREALETLKTLLRRVIDGLTAEEHHHIPRRERLP